MSEEKIIYTKALEMNIIATKQHIDKIKKHYNDKILSQIKESAQYGMYHTCFNRYDIYEDSNYLNEVEQLRKDGFYVEYKEEAQVYDVRWDDYYITNKNIEENKGA